MQWPGKDIKSAIDGALAQKAGYVYIIFESYDNVSALIANCQSAYQDSMCRHFYTVSSRRCKGKEVQVIPFDIGDRFHMKGAFAGQMDHSKTVFVGALHGMITADGLAKVMEDLFGGVVFAGLDTDKYKYPLGSGRVAFDNHDSFYKAVSAAFVEVKCSLFRKKMQIDPYIEAETKCEICKDTKQRHQELCLLSRLGLLPLLLQELLGHVSLRQGDSQSSTHHEESHSLNNLSLCLYQITEKSKSLLCFSIY